MKLTGYNHHHHHHKLFQPRSRVTDTISNGIQSLGRLRGKAMDTARRIHWKVDSVKKPIEQTARAIDKGIRGAYAGYRFLEPVLPLDRETKMGIRNFMGQYDATSNRNRQTYDNPIRELVLPHARRAFHGAVIG